MRDVAQYAPLNDAFHRMHLPGNPLLVGAAWDAASAVVLERAGFGAIATTSGGTAWTNGCADGNHVSKADLLRTVAQIRAAVRVPLSVDIEGALAPDVDSAHLLVSVLANLGVQGVNFEDSWDGALVDIDAHVERIAAIRQNSPDTFLNARVDTFFFGSGDTAQRINTTVKRARAFLAAGAHGIFVPGVTDLTVIAQLASRIDAPLNVMASVDGASTSDFASVGVARVSWGTAFAESAYDRADQLARQILDPSATTRTPVDYPTLNSVLTSRW